MATWSLYFNNTSNNANNNTKDYPPSEPNTVDTHPYPINPNHPTNPNYKPTNRNSISDIIRNAKSTMSYNRGESKMENKQIGFNSTQSSESEMIRGMIQDTIKPLEKMFNKLKSKVDEMDDERGFTKITSKGMEGKQLFEMLPKLGKKAIKLLKDKPPKTWKKYLEDDEPDFESIYEMEVKELCEAMKEGKESVDRELTHVMAALFGMLMEKCSEDD